MSSQPPTRPPTSNLTRITTQYRRALNRRWFDFNLRAALLTALITSSTTFFVTRSLSTIWAGFFGGLAAFPVLLYPVLSVRRRYITSPPVITAKSAVLPSFLAATTSTLPFLLIGSYLVLATSFTILYTQIINLSGSDQELGLFRPTNRYPLHLNERVNFLLWGNFWFFFLLALVDLVKPVFNASWPSRRTPLFVAARSAMKSGLYSLLQVVPIHGLSSFQFPLFAPVWSVGYWYFRRRVWRFLVQWGLGSFMINWARSSRTHLSSDLIFHLYVINFASMSLLRLSTSLLTVYVTQPLAFDSLVRKSGLTPDRYLLLALKSNDQYHVHFTLMELLRVIRDAKRRARIFIENPEKPGRQPILVHELFQELLLHLGQSYQTLATRGGTRSLAASPPPRPQEPDPRAMPVRQADVFRPVAPKKSTIGLKIQNVLDGPVRPTPPAVLNAEHAVMDAESKALKQVEDVAMKAVKRIEGVPAGEKAVVATRGVIDNVTTWFGGEWAKRSVETSIPHPENVGWIIDILITLAVASADEDQYGFVQSVMPAALEAIVRYRSALLNLESELLFTSQSIGKAGERAGQEAKSLLAIQVSACDRGILRVGERFGKSLAAFRFSPAIASQLADICRPLETVEE